MDRRSPDWEFVQQVCESAYPSALNEGRVPLIHRSVEQSSVQNVELLPSLSLMAASGVQTAAAVMLERQRKRFA